MLATLLTITIASGALIFGAVWGAVWGMSKRLEGFLIAMAGGALIYASVDQMIVPAMEHLAPWSVAGALAAGAVVFTVADRWVETREQDTGQSGRGLALAVTVDGVPENLALGTALIASSPTEVAALAAAILLSNLPESAGSAGIMRHHGIPAPRILRLWTAVAALLVASGLAGYWMFASMPAHILALIHGFAAGAVLSSLATEVFPSAYRDNSHDAGIAVAVGVILSMMLGQLA